VPLDLASSTSLRIGDWKVDTATGAMSRGEQLVRLEERSLRLLLCLAQNAGEVLSIDELLKQVWPGVIVSPDSIYQAITSLRRQLGDDPKHPAYIATVPRRGYRLIAAVTPRAQAPGPLGASRLEGPSSPEPKPARHSGPLMLAITLIVLLAAIVSLGMLTWYAPVEISATPATPVANPRAVAVLPFLDLTDQMSEEPFADGMSEELIGKLSKVPGLAVAPAASSFYYKAKQVTVAEVAKNLRVAFVLDGSVRKSGRTLRVAARLTRASDGFIVWSETYDRSWDDKLMIQEDIAGEVSKALTASIH
jgi:transcriptional activator of cad operon